MNKKYLISSIIITGLITVIFSTMTYYSDLASIETVRLNLAGLEDVNLDLSSLSFILIVNLTNPTSQDIYNLSSKFDIYIESIYIGKGNFSDVFLPALNNITIPMDTKFMLKDLATSTLTIIENLIKGQKTIVTIKGTMYSNALFGLVPIEYPFTATYTP